MKYKKELVGFHFLFLLGTPVLSSADNISDNGKLIRMNGECIKTPKGPEQDACIVKMEEAISKMLIGCDNIAIITEKVDCYKRFSDEGNSDASYELGKAYDAGSSDFKGLEKNSAEATKYKLQAYKQGNLSAKAWYLTEYIPPKPYNWEIGMSRNQVRNSINGAPLKIVKTTTSNGESETWIYTGATLHFGSGVYKQLELIQELKSTR